LPASSCHLAAVDLRIVREHVIRCVFDDCVQTSIHGSYGAARAC